MTVETADRRSRSWSVAILSAIFAAVLVTLSPVSPGTDNSVAMPGASLQQSPGTTLQQSVEGGTSAIFAASPAAAQPAVTPRVVSRQLPVAFEGRTSAPAATRSSGNTLKMGERIKVTFFEMLDIPDNHPVAGREPAESSLHTFYQRMDLTGDYLVQPNGTITLPRLGPFAVADREPRTVESELAVAFQREMGITATVSVVVTERLPIYVVGAVKSAGSYKHMPGMMVLHGVALAGGLDRSLLTVSQHVDRIRERERLQRAGIQLERLLARRTMLITERDNAETMAAPARLLWLAGKRRADELLADEANLRTFATSARRAEAETLRLAAESADVELNALRRELPNFDEQVGLHNERLKDVQGLGAKGIVVRKDVISVKSEIADIEGRRQSALVSIAQAERKLAQAEQARAKFEVDCQLRLMQELVRIEQEIDETEATLAAATSIEGIMEVATGATARDEERSVSYEIVRRGPGGTTQMLPTEETSELEPGDVLRVTTKSADKQMRASYQPERAGEHQQDEPGFKHLRSRR